MYSTRQKHPSPGRISRIRMCSKLSWGLHNLITSSRAPGRGSTALSTLSHTSPETWYRFPDSLPPRTFISLGLFTNITSKKRKVTKKEKSRQPWPLSHGSACPMVLVCSEMGWEGSSAQQAVHGEPLAAQEVVGILFGSLRQLGCS